MQLKKLLIGFLIIGIMACNKSVTTIPEIPVAPVVDNTTVTKITNADINTWIHENMSAYYLWPDKMPALAKTNTSSNPMDYFYSILNDYPTTDRFSWIDSSSANLINQLNGVNTVLGIRVSAFYTDDTKANVGSFTITDNAKRWNYGLQPITFKILNAVDQSDYGTVNGFLPDYALLDDALPYKLLGDPNETYLNKALSIIGPVAYKANANGPVTTVSRANKLQAASISDNPIQDKFDMFDKPLKHKN